MVHTCDDYVRECDTCQRSKKKQNKYGKLPHKETVRTPWKNVCADLIGPYTIRGKDGTVLEFMCLTMINPATGWFEIIELPCQTVLKKTKEGKMLEKVIFDKSSHQVARLFNKQWLSRYPRATNITYDNGSEFKLNFEALCDSYGLKRKPTTIKNPQANAILERIHPVSYTHLRAHET